MIEFYIANTQITCLPNRVVMDSNYYNCDIKPDTMALCTASSGCDFYYNIAGTVHYDTATTCTLDSLYPSAPITNMKVQLRQNGQVIQQFYTFGSGGYSFRTPSLSSYTVTVDTSLLPLAVTCPQSGVRSVSLSPTDTVEKGKSFGMQCASAELACTASMVAASARRSTRMCT
jgi:hypothetical protein